MTSGWTLTNLEGPAAERLPLAAHRPPPGVDHDEEDDDDERPIGDPDADEDWDDEDWDDLDEEDDDEEPLQLVARHIAPRLAPEGNGLRLVQPRAGS